MKNKKNQKDFQFIRQLKNIFLSKSVLISLAVTLLIVLFFNLTSKISMPYIKVNDNAEQSSFTEMLNLLGGGGLTRLSLFATGISPYITTQIIIQLLSSDVFPPLAKLAKGGERGRKKMEVITRCLTLPFTLIQAYSILAILEAGGVASFAGPDGSTTMSDFYRFFYIMLMTAGTYIAIFLSDIITKKGVGNGITTIILAGIVSSIIGNFSLVKSSIDSSITTGALYQVMAFIVYLLFYIAIFWTIAFISCSTRKIPIQQTGQSLVKLGDDLPYLPFKLNTAGVIPVIFASSLMTLPLTISEIVERTNPTSGFVTFAKTVFDFNSIGGILVYIILIILFTFFYSYVQLNPNKISTDFMKSGRFIIGVKIGVSTEKYISKVLYRINWIGGPFLAVITSLPYITSYITGGIIPSVAALGGTGIIIMVSGSIDLWQSIVSASTTSSYTTRRKKIQNVDINSVTSSNEEIGLW